MYNQGAQAYLRTQQTTASPRELEASLLTKAAAKLQSARDDAGMARLPLDEAIRRLSQLTRQQANILEQICAGKMNKQIAYDLSIAETTVKAHVTAIMRKLEVYSRTQAVLLAREAHSTGAVAEPWRWR